MQWIETVSMAWVLLPEWFGLRMVQDMVDVELQVLEGCCLVGLEHGGPGYAEGRYSEEPQRLGVALSLHQHSISGVSDLRQPPFSVEADFPG